MKNILSTAIQKYSQINTDFDKTLKSSDLHNIARTPLDRLLSDLTGISNEIPILRTLTALIQTGFNVSDQMFTNKLISFLIELKDTDAQKRREMINKIEDEGKYKIKVGDKLLYIIDKSSDYIKVGYVGKLFAAYINEQIDFSQFIKCVHAIELSDIDTLNSFITDCTEDNLFDMDYTPYLLMGVIRLGDIDNRSEHYRNNPAFSKVGKLYPSINGTGKTLKDILRIQ